MFILDALNHSIDSSDGRLVRSGHNELPPVKVGIFTNYVAPNHMHHKCVFHFSHNQTLQTDATLMSLYK